MDGALGQRGPQSRGAQDQGAIWGGFLLVTFLCPHKEKLPAVGQPPTVVFELEREARDTIQILDPRFRGDDDTSAAMTI